MSGEVNGWLQVAVQIAALLGIAWRFLARVESQSQLVALEIRGLSMSVSELKTEVQTLRGATSTLDKRLAVIEDRAVRGSM